MVSTSLILLLLSGAAAAADSAADGEHETQYLRHQRRKLPFGRPAKPSLGYEGTATNHISTDMICKYDSILGLPLLKQPQTSSMNLMPGRPGTEQHPSRNTCVDGVSGLECQCDIGNGNYKCKDFRNDPDFCGGCPGDIGHDVCDTSRNEACCDAVCTDLDNDDSNCGACGDACHMGYHCRLGMCVEDGESGDDTA